jgi:porin
MPLSAFDVLHRRRGRGFLLLVFAIAFGPAPALMSASPAVSPDLPPTQRPALQVTGAYTGEVMTVVTGGIRTGAVYRGLAEAAVDADLGVLGVPRDLQFHLSAHAPHGGDFSGTRLGDLQGASNIAASNHPLLFEAWFGARFAGERGEVRVGRLAADAEFASTEGGGAFLNSSFGWPAFISANTRNVGPAYNRSATGAWARLKLTERLAVQGGVYDGDSFDSPEGDPTRHPNGLHFEFGHGQGVFALAEAALIFPAPGGEVPAATFKFGAWQHTAGFADQFDATRQHSGNHGLYVVGEVTLWQAAPARPDSPPRQLGAFARYGTSPQERSRLHRTADAGLHFVGLVPGRPEDVAAVGFAWVGVSPEVRRAERRDGAGTVSDYELAVEASYTLAVRDRWSLIPDLQWVRHPGGSPALRDALVLGLRTRLEF